MRVALDAMGGDAGPGPIVAGAARAVRASRELRVVLVGDLIELERCLAAAGGPHRRLNIFHASQNIADDESPASTLRIKPDSSIARCWQLLVEHKVEGVISTGNPEACVAAGLRHQRFLRGVRKPALAATIPTARGPALLVDVAANTNPTPAHRYQYGLMGTVYAQTILDKPRPTIALLSVGADAATRHEHTRETAKLFRHSPLAEQFLGSIEGDDVHRGSADVIVTDAFVGRMLLKLWEGACAFAAQLAGAASQAAAPVLGPFLGMERHCFACYGSPSEQTIEQALALVARAEAAGLNSQIVKQLENGPLVTSA
jgi:phosphate acyltransferase